MTIKTFIYLRVSTDQQDADSQMLGITNYCEKNEIRNMNIFKDTKSGALSWRERELENILNQTKENDQLIVSELSRIGRGTADVLDFLAKAASKKLKIVAVKNNMIFDGSISSKIFATVMALASEIERDFIRQRTKEGMQNAREKGVIIGRPKGKKSGSKLDKQSREIEKLLTAEVNKSSICKILNCSRGTLDRYILDKNINKTGKE